jgi:cytochrome c-type biogenesis protein CcmH/NrfF
MSIKVVFAMTLLALVFAAPAAASERHPTLGELQREVMCPTCHQLLELSNAPVADRIRAFIQNRIKAGDTKSEIKHRLVSEFGEAVLAAPPAHGFDLLAWLLPILGLAGVGAVLAALARRCTREARDSVKPFHADGGPGLDPGLARRLEEELALLDR